MNEVSNLECHALATGKLLSVLRMNAVPSHSGRAFRVGDLFGLLNSVGEGHFGPSKRR
jgi:hypothetical protein